MGWVRVGFKGKNSLEPSSNLSQSTEGLDAAEAPLAPTATNRLSYTGAWNFTDLTDIRFNDITASTFDTDGISEWVRDFGNTTT